MNELIKIQDMNGRRAVSARELYDNLGLHKANWAKWYRKNIIDNPFASEGGDWAPLILSMSNANSQDFALSIEFAKKLSMMARTPEGEKVRDYFIEVEKVALDPINRSLSIAEMMLQSAQLHVEHERKMVYLEQKQIVIEEKVERLHHIQEQNQLELSYMPLSNEAAAPVSLRKQISVLVGKYAVATNIPFRNVWSHLYEALEYRYHIRLNAYKKISDTETLIDVAERIGALDKLHIIISDKIRNIPKRA